jgi:Amt family ammonium transporter
MSTNTWCKDLAKAAAGSGDASRPFLDMLPCAAFIERAGELIPANLLASQIAGTDEGQQVSQVFERGYPAVNGDDRVRFDGLVRRTDGNSIEVSGAVQGFPVAGGTGRLVLLMEVLRGASEGNAVVGAKPIAAGTPETTDNYLQELFDSSPEPTIIVYGTTILSANREFLQMFGYSLAQCLGADTHDLIIPEGRHHESEILLHTVLASGRASMETVRRTAGGEALDVSLNLTRVRLGRDRMGLCITFRDIRAQKQTEARLQHASLHDPLTGLANRVLFLDRVTLTMARFKRRPDRPFAVVFLDVDHFKHVNDTYGHAAGDAVLLAVTARLRTSLRPQDTVARFGGDEFALLLDEVSGGEDIDRLADRIQAEMRQSIDVAGSEVFVSASMGIAISSTTYVSADEIMRDADVAMYAAKAAGKARHEFFGFPVPPVPALAEQQATVMEADVPVLEATPRRTPWPASWGGCGEDGFVGRGEMLGFPHAKQARREDG